VKVYVESNFVLEIALAQEQHQSCEKILDLRESGLIFLAIPAYSLIEPYETLTRRHRKRSRLKTQLDDELTQISRNASNAQRLWGFRSATDLLIDTVSEEAESLDLARDRLIETAEIIPLDAAVLADAARYVRKHDFSPQDAIVYASVMCDLGKNRPSTSVFLNKNSRDFDDPDIVKTLEDNGCKLLPKFDSGYDYIRRFASSPPEAGV
jgi:predicted nucleic acid-binding protein